jgi:hypothetical protein
MEIVLQSSAPGAAVKKKEPFIFKEKKDVPG